MTAEFVSGAEGASAPLGRASGPGGAAPISVSALVARVKEALLDQMPQRLVVIGQVSNFKRQSSGHLYFSLKDASASINAVMFAGDAAYVRFDLADGMEVVAQGRVDVWEPQGRLQLYVNRLWPNGMGDLEVAFRQLKEKLGKEGLFDPAHKKVPARFPRAIGVITSPTGAAVRDIARTLRRRWPCVAVYLLAAKVQGQGAAEEIAQAIALLDGQAGRLGIDTLILARGGGSLEDLWAFNEEVVARAIYAARTPIICGVGHETDFTIADFVADVRAATPTAAAELATPDGAEFRRHIAQLAGRLNRRLRDLLSSGRQGLLSVTRSVVFRDPGAALRSRQQQLDELSGRLRHGLVELARQGEGRLAQAKAALQERHPRRLIDQASARLGQRRRDLAWALGHRAKLAGDALARRIQGMIRVHPRNRLALSAQHLASLARQLESLSYRSVLQRGFTVTRTEGIILRSARQVPPGAWLETEFAEGKVRSTAAGSSRRKAAPEQTPSLFDDSGAAQVGKPVPPRQQEEPHGQ